MAYRAEPPAGYTSTITTGHHNHRQPFLWEPHQPDTLQRVSGWPISGGVANNRIAVPLPNIFSISGIARSQKWEAEQATARERRNDER